MILLAKDTLVGSGKRDLIALSVGLVTSQLVRRPVKLANFYCAVVSSDRKNGPDPALALRVLDFDQNRVRGHGRIAVVRPARGYEWRVCRRVGYHYIAGSVVYQFTVVLVPDNLPGKEPVEAVEPFIGDQFAGVTLLISDRLNAGTPSFQKRFGSGWEIDAQTDHDLIRGNVRQRPECGPVCRPLPCTTRALPVWWFDFRSDGPSKRHQPHHIARGKPLG